MTTIDHLHPHILQTHILPRLDGPSLSTVATASSLFNHLCSDHSLWSHISTSTWPSITHPRLHDVISTFPSGHRTFFDDSFPTLTTAVDHRTRRRSWPDPKSPRPSCNIDCSSLPSELISAVDIRYQNDVVYSTVNFTEPTPEFLSSPVQIALCEPEPVTGVSRSIDVAVDAIAGADRATLSHLTASLTLNWILIDPSRKRACNLSSIKPVCANADWVSNETHIRFVTVLPGCDLSEMVQCRIDVVLGVGKKGLEVKEVVLRLIDLDSCCLNGVEFLVVVEGAMMEENNVRRKVVGDDERMKRYKEFKEMKREKRLWVKKKQREREVVVNFGFVVVIVLLFIFVYFVML